MRILLLIYLILTFSSCTNDVLAPIEYNHNKTNKEKNQNYSQKTFAKIEDEEIEESAIEVGEMQEAESSLSTGDDFQTYDNVFGEDNYKIIYHEVAENEDLDDIAKNFKLDPSDIRKLNNMKPDEEVEELQIIKIKVPAGLLNKKNNELIKKRPEGKYIRPIEGNVTSKFGEIVNGKKSSGIIIAAKEGTPIKSIGTGEVIYTDTNPKFGNLVIVKLTNSNIYVAYAHMQKQMLAKNSKVEKGEIIGHVGVSGSAPRPQLYLAIREGKLEVDPEKYVSY